MLVRAVEKEYTYRDKRYSITSLLEPDRVVMLKRRYNDKIKQDIVDCIFMLHGTKVHYELENIELKPNEFVEDHLEYTFDNGYTLSGIIDHYDDEFIDDYKTCKAYSVIYKSDYDKWKKQLQMGAYLVYKKTGVWRKKGRIIAILKDWNKTKAETNRSYPKYAVKVIRFNLGTPEKVEKMILKRFDEIIKLEKLKDKELPLCTMKERFNKGNLYVVKKIKNKMAKKIHKTKEEAEEHLKRLNETYPNTYEIVVREQNDLRCTDYCSVNKFCQYYQEKYIEKEK